MSRHPFRLASTLPGMLLGVAIATALVLSASPVDAGAKRGAGMKCSYGAQCRSRTCRDGFCTGNRRERRAAGARCSDNSDCKSYECHKHYCRGNGEDREPGARCRHDEDCRTGDCVKGFCD